MTIKELIKELEKYPDNMMVHAYEGEDEGIRIDGTDGEIQIGWISTRLDDASGGMDKNIILQGDCLEVLKTLEDNSVDACVTDPPYGLSFMGKKWDYDVPGVEVWKEVLRVLKPGGYLLSFAGTRTQHRMAVKIEDAGFEIRDMIAWIYGSGFPKSLNIGKAVDKLQGNEREVVGQSRNGSNSLMGGLSGTETTTIQNITKGTSQWEGWGTALKPALEPITVARKPIEGTVAENCLKWGVGGINIDATRVGIEKVSAHHAPKGTFAGGEQNRGSYKNYYENQGRFPSNLIHDGSDEVVGLFPESKSGKGKKAGTANSSSMFAGAGRTGNDDYGDSGSAARFFYCAKASKSERNMGCEDIESKKADLRSDIAAGIWKDHNAPHNNSHPTVKPLSLMEYLIKLVSREGQLILDPFAGSGSTLIACKNLNRDYIGIEREAEYIKIAEERLKSVPERLL